MSDKNKIESDIVDGCAKGDPLAQKKLFELYASKMFGVCLRYASSKQAAEDVLQDAFIKVFEKIGTFKKEGSLEGWVRRIVVNTALDDYRKNKQQRESIEIDDVAYKLHDTGNHIVGNISAKELLKVLQDIPDGYRTVFNLYAIEGYSHKEIAEKLNVSVNTSKSQYSRARAHIQDLLERLNIEKY